jgi:hypothetical protein
MTSGKYTGIIKFMVYLIGDTTQEIGRGGESNII